ncbi:unnamed protein product [Spirodela intermedia]|uniref:Uncharacterized protein n=1 Tax=Spirodela intermedia TaxID=51605 RepID=A0ABN7E903_SPIIN|nr:unnamed protein product [Spirodela intermedia]
MRQVLAPILFLLSALCTPPPGLPGIGDRAANMVLEDGAKELAEELKEQKQTAVLLVKLLAGLIFTIYGPLHRVIFCVSAILLIVCLLLSLFTAILATVRRSSPAAARWPESSIAASLSPLPSS